MHLITSLHEVADEDKEETKLDEEIMILVGTILCPLKIGKTKFIRTIKAKNNKVDTKGMVKGHKMWHIDDEKLMIGVGVSRFEEFEDKDNIRMKSHEKTIPSMCMGTTYTSMKVFLWLLILSMIFCRCILLI